MAGGGAAVTASDSCGLSTVWALAGGMISLVAGAGISVVRGAESDTAAGSLGA